ncbi:MAG: SRPBCC family protein [Planctomycetota bacterium]
MENKDNYARLVLPAKLQITRTLPAPPEKVWEFLVDPELRKMWFCAGETGNKEGDPFVMDFDHSRISKSKPPEGMNCGDPVIMQGTILTFDRPHVLSYRWPGENESSETIVTIHLSNQDGRTLLNLTHEGLSNPDFQNGASAGWHVHLDLLCDHVAGSQPRDFWVHFGLIEAEYDRKFEAKT